MKTSQMSDAFDFLQGDLATVEYSINFQVKCNKLNAGLCEIQTFIVEFVELKH